MNQLKARLSGAQLILFLIAVALAPLAVACSGTNPDRDYAAESSSPAGWPSDVLTPVAFDPEKLPAEFPNRCAEITDEQIAEAGLRRSKIPTSYNAIQRFDSCGFHLADPNPQIMSVSLIRDDVPVEELKTLTAALSPSNVKNPNVYFHLHSVENVPPERDECVASIDTAGGHVASLVIGTGRNVPDGGLCRYAEDYLTVFVKDWGLRS